MKTYYEALRIEENASPIEIKKAYRALALRHHPDKGGDEENFRALKEIYEFLMDPVKREKYDANLKKWREKNAEKERIKKSGLEAKIVSTPIKIISKEIKIVQTKAKVEEKEATIQYKQAKIRYK